MNPLRPAREPEIIEMPSQKMATIYAKGRPDEVLPRVLPALMSALMALKFETSIKGDASVSLGVIRARFPDAHLLPVEEWTNVVGLPVPDSTLALPQPVGGAEIKLETWEYGTVAQIDHGGNLEGRESPGEKLHRFINETGHEIIGVHEEEYTADRDNSLVGTIIRYRVKAK